MKKTLKNFRFPPETIQKLDELVELTGEDQTAIVIEAIECFGEAAALRRAAKMEDRAAKIRRTIKTSLTPGSVAKGIVDKGIAASKKRNAQ